jgi:transcription antitermination factor NusG
MDTRKWLAVYTKPRWEKKVHQQLQVRGFESYCPLTRVHKKWSDRIKTVEEPLFRSYLFVRVNEEEQTAVRMVNGVVNFLYWQGKPAVVTEKEINIIRRFLMEHSDAEARPIDLRPDQKVRIYSGVLMDKEAKVIKVNGRYVEVVIETMGFKLVATVKKTNVGHA